MKRFLITLFLAGMLFPAAAQQVDHDEPAYDFTLLDTANQPVRLADFRGKIVIIDVWHSSCSSCIYFYQHKFSPIMKSLRRRNDIVFLSISLDNDVSIWKKRVSEGKFTSSKATNVYVGELGIKHPIRTQLGIQAVPHVHVIDQRGHAIDAIPSANRYSKEELARRINALL